MTEISIFDGEQPLQITKPLRLIELFAGYGSQHLALKYLGIPCESYAISEWAVKSIQAYKDLHCPDDNHPYDTAFSDKEIKNYLKGKISADYSTPLSDEQIERMPIDRARQIVRNMFATNNKGSITAIKAADIRLEEGYTYLLTYSFPCQDLSSAGRQAGMERGSATRSGLLWEVERLLNEWSGIGKVPDILLMENVPEVVGQKNRAAWSEWIAALDKLGYKSYWKILNATDFGIPQNRERCFMVSVYGDYYFEFPLARPLNIRLKDVLQKNVAENYYLSDETVAKFIWNPGEKKDTDTVVVKKGEKDARHVEVAKTLQARDYKDCRTVSTREGIKAVVEEIGHLPGFEMANRVYDRDGIAPALRTFQGGNLEPKIIEEPPSFRIRKLTETECFRLMGVKDEDSERVHRNQSKSSMYHLAGDSIVTAVLMAIFGSMFDMDWHSKIKELQENITHESRTV